jgi:hypothetical protein
MKRTKFGKMRGSFLPVLDWVIRRTDGPILELGVGFCSSPYLHWMCYPQKRRLVSYEGHPDFFEFANSWQDTFHEVHCSADWDAADLSQSWSIAFVDHSPGERRAIETARLTHADFVVIHDSEGRSEKNYHLSTVEHLFRYRWKWLGAYPQTSVWSNRFEPNELFKGFP